MPKFWKVLVLIKKRVFTADDDFDDNDFDDNDDDDNDNDNLEAKHAALLCYAR